MTYFLLISISGAVRNRREEGRAGVGLDYGFCAAKVDGVRAIAYNLPLPGLPAGAQASCEP